VNDDSQELQEIAQQFATDQFSVAPCELERHVVRLLAINDNARQRDFERAYTILHDVLDPMRSEYPPVSVGAETSLQIRSMIERDWNLIRGSESCAWVLMLLAYLDDRPEVLRWMRSRADVEIDAQMRLRLEQRVSELSNS
jgi:hypothetical protein